ncbi:collagen alpha-1(III) chain-like isoform X5 [Monodelphis domestica]|uniref:collagen alpha-1(III) chain-like isoform X5 n=1 Tax=Monodelphis domestica TaxID=13616 RepID=UPI0024E1D3E8|nr:collagen alpha-1(III) chain-like isoform X5 [Monodelphis domestica]
MGRMQRTRKENSFLSGTSLLWLVPSSFPPPPRPHLFSAVSDPHNVLHGGTAETPQAGHSRGSPSSGGRPVPDWPSGTRRALGWPLPARPRLPGSPPGLLSSLGQLSSASPAPSPGGPVPNSVPALPGSSCWGWGSPTLSVTPAFPAPTREALLWPGGRGCEQGLWGEAQGPPWEARTRSKTHRSKSSGSRAWPGEIPCVPGGCCRGRSQEEGEDRKQVFRDMNSSEEGGAKTYPKAGQGILGNGVLLPLGAGRAEGPAIRSRSLRPGEPPPSAPPTLFSLPALPCCFFELEAASGYSLAHSRGLINFHGLID